MEWFYQIKKNETIQDNRIICYGNEIQQSKIAVEILKYQMKVKCLSKYYGWMSEMVKKKASAVYRIP